MITLDDLFDRDLFSRMVEERYVRVQHSSELAIVNYTERAQFDREWNDVTLNCRGLIYNTDTLEVIARGFKKFFNWDDSSQPFPPKGPCLRAPKMDGSLGILYLDGHWVHVATRGSFLSDQAQWASGRIMDMHNSGEVDWDDLRMDTHSYLCEIIYPENRIVVDYGNDEKLILLDVLDTATGKSDLAEFDRVTWPHKVEKISLPGFEDTMASDIPRGEEGFVFYWPQKDFRVKMKAAEYIELHRMIFGLNARSVWQRMGDGETVEQIAEKLPDEFHPWVRQIGEDLIKQRDFAIREAKNHFVYLELRLPQNYTRKQFAELAVRLPTKGYLFMLADGKSIEDEVWKSLRPAGNIGVTTISEDVA